MSQMAEAISARPSIYRPLPKVAADSVGSLQPSRGKI
jgi:hypothetical protein